MNAPQCYCPICKSDNTYSFESIYHSLLTDNFSKLFAERKLRFNGQRDKIKFQKLILERTAPPLKPTISSFELLISVIGGLIGMAGGIGCNEILKAFFGNHFQILILIFTLIGYFKTLHLSYRYWVIKKKLKWEDKIKHWQSSWICLRCSNNWLE